MPVPNNKMLRNASENATDVEDAGGGEEKVFRREGAEPSMADARCTACICGVSAPVPHGVRGGSNSASVW
jgi:hypothetical protein